MKAGRPKLDPSEKLQHFGIRITPQTKINAMSYPPEQRRAIVEKAYKKPYYNEMESALTGKVYDV